ncbi:hypothetical protein [Dyella monticola]|uniref:hypothetical protein n=1 Tax=Dyella monticola TaxID=1927958 RepID=UPI001314BA05|nr:hypothetical protein [Dyella monticola]
MKFENLFLRGLFGACVLICGWTLAAMVTASPASSATVTASHTIAATANGAPAHARMVG